MKTKIVVPLMLVLMLALTGTAMARGGYHGGFHNGNTQPFSQLTVEKQQQVDAILAKYETEFETIRSQMWAKRTELNALVASGIADKQTISALVKEMSDLRTKSYNLRKKVSDEIETATGIVMPTRGPGMGSDNGRGNDRPRMQNYGKGGGCWNYNN